MGHKVIFNGHGQNKRIQNTYFYLPFGLVNAMISM